MSGCGAPLAIPASGTTHDPTNRLYSNASRGGAVSEFPSLPLFTDAYLADTRHLSALEHGAYLLLLMMAWRSPHCCLPNDDETLARWASVDARTWKRIKPRVMGFWTLAEDQWSQARLTREREFVSKRADVARANGKLGGKPKRLKSNGSDNPAGFTQATQPKAPNPNPSPIAATQQPRVWPVDRIIEAASANGGCQPSLVTTVGQILAYRDKGYDLDRDILPVIRSKASPSVGSWRYFGKIIEANALQQSQIAVKPPTPDEDWPGRMKVWADGTWVHGWGPKPGEPGCRVPAELLTAKAA